MDNFTAGLIGVHNKEAQVQTIPIFIPREATAYEVFDFLKHVGMPKRYEFYPEGIDVHLQIPPAHQARILPKATERGFTIGGYAQRPASRPAGEHLGATTTDTAEEVVSWPVAKITQWLYDNGEELGERDYQGLLAAEMNGKNRSTVVKTLKGLLGEDDA